MPEQVVQQKVRGFICVNAHPAGCEATVDQQIAHVKSADLGEGPKSALVIGSSTGYGLSSRIALGFGFGAKTLGVFFEKPPAGKRPATAGWYNSAAFERRADEHGLWAASLNGDAFSDELKQQAAERIRNEMGKVDTVIYSLASPRRTNPRTGEQWMSALKPIGASYSGKTIELGSGEVTTATVEPATEEEIRQTVGVMGGEDWRWWIEMLREQDLLAPGARTLAYSYIGPELTWPIYRDGTIGRAKQDLERVGDELDALLAAELGGGAWVSVNKAVVTQASSAIPVVPLYISLLFRVMKEKGIHEGCIEQLARLCADHLAAGKQPAVDAKRRIRLDDLEMREDVQNEVARLWPQVTTENLDALSDFAGLKRDFNQLFGFEVEGVDYAAPVETEVGIKGLDF
ncbi:MAG: trans-2-enoyl-CoA reductase family protein [Bryobacterales bacterium]|nr:trans-2-enoyl-CoA reductase family protein [Bryobacterales bacterium]